MRIAILATTLAFAIPAAARDAKISPKIDFGATTSTSAAKAKPTLSPEEEKKRAAAMDANRDAAEQAKAKAWDTRMKRIMGGICRGC
jgi:hypothetical protein